MILKDLSLSFGLENIFSNINLIIPNDSKVGVVGANGAGKTTLFKLILGYLEADSGKILDNKKHRTLWLPQVIDSNILESNISVYNFLKEGRPIDQLEMSLVKCYEEISIETDKKIQDQLMRQVIHIQSELDYYEQYEYENILLDIIEGMNIDLELLDMPMKTLSGGQKSKVAFAKLLYSKPETILLDEPTNHLDASTKDYVIDFLKNYKGSVLVISHDIDFLDAVVDKILFIDKVNKKMELFTGNYTKFKKTETSRAMAIEKEAIKEEKEIKRLKAVVELYSNSSGKRKRMAQSREKVLDKMLKNKIEVTKKINHVDFKLKIKQESSNIPVIVNNISFKYDKGNIINNLSFNINKKERFLIVGKNGVGKSTLLKLIIGQLKPQSGNIKLDHKTTIGYYAQEHESLDENRNIIDNFNDLDVSIKELRSALGRFLFHGDEVYKLVKVLSPGERSRVALAKLSLLGANMLVLDEPTNHLDPETQRVIASAFKSYPGTMLVVSHSPEFVDNIGIERLLILPEGKITYYDSKIVNYYKIENEKNTTN